ncbi:MAG: threonylcarbamoyl-AMP synthase [Candidatus Stahlbacteria bacterium]|nr:threonylcarbamoyl-AMP synthase [Candidatus Stahlbacteria bacterium]
MDIIDRAILVLKQGGIIGFPTDTVYGIGCDASKKQSISKIYELKNRTPSKPLILFIKDKTELNKYVEEISDVGERLIDKFWPGALTIIFKSKFNRVVAGPLTCRMDTVAIRIPNYEPILTILRNYAAPLATTSANLEETAAPKSDLELNITPDLVIPGKCGSGIESTIVDISEDKFAILREGEIKYQELAY